jgi:hypothetical protein
MSNTRVNYEVRFFFTYGDFESLAPTIASQCNALAAEGHRLVSTERVDSPRGTVGIIMFFEGEAALRGRAREREALAGVS